MFNKMIVRKVMFPISSAALLSASVFAASEENKAETEGKKDEEKKELVRRKDLSIYPAKKEEKPPAKEEKEEEKKSESPILTAVKEVREALWKASDEVTDLTDKVNNVIETGKAHMSSALDNLRDKDHYAQRISAISAGGLVGYIIAIRRGWFRKFVYTATGGAAVAAIIYPDEAEEYASEGFQVAKKYIVIAYHFINGVLRDYAGVQLPSLPGPLAIGSSSAAEKDSSTVPTSAALMPHTASAPSHISASAGPIPLPPLDPPSSVSDKQGNGDGDGKKQGKETSPSKSPKGKKEKEEKPGEDKEAQVPPEKEAAGVQPSPASFVFPGPRHPAEQNPIYSMYSRRA